MNPLREVIAKFSVIVDDQGVQGLGKKIDALKGSYGALALGATAALGMAAAASYKFIQAASGVTETQNKIEALFGKGARQEIIAWSRTVEGEMGRSEYSFQQTFSDFAAFLDPLGLGTEKVITMSKALAKLKVDLASFYNTSEEDAGMRLFSGLAGETEAVRRLGIDISDTALTALYNSKDNPLAEGQPGKGGHGLNRGKGIASLTLQDKALLRYKKILMDTTKAQGDARRTATGWANTLKRLTDRFFRLEVAIGKLVEGPGTKFLNMLEGMVQWMEKVTTRTSAFQTAFSMLGAAAVLWTGKWILANQKLLVSLAPIAAEIGVILAAFLAIEDVWTFFSDPDAQTGFGKLLTAITGVERPLNAVKDAFAKIHDHIAKAYNILLKWAPTMRVLAKLGVIEDVPMNDHTAADNKNDRAKKRGEALANGDWETFRQNAESGMTLDQVKTAFMKGRGEGVVSGKYKPMEEDESNPYSKDFVTAPAKGGGYMVSGPVTVSPVVHNHFSGSSLTVGDVEVTTRRVMNEAAQTAAQALTRRGSR